MKHVSPTRVFSWAVALCAAGGLWVWGCENDGPAIPPACVVDDLFCNGVERVIGGECVKVPARPCDDGVECTEDLCDEEADSCTHVLTGDCAVCDAGGCVPDCTGRECGDDGCGGVCGACSNGRGCASSVGVCKLANQPGTCASPRVIDVLLGQTQSQVLTGDSTAALHQLAPACGGASAAVEDVYAFEIVAPTGIDARSYGLDTVLYLRKEDPTTPGTECLVDAPHATVACSDDSAPPGNGGSRVEALLEPGVYYLVVDGFDSTQAGPYTLTVTFVAGCAPQCDGKFCGGSDMCGADCGTCGDGLACGPDLRCRPFPCEAMCQNDDGSPRVCGDDGCLGECGKCGADELCVLATGTCQVFAPCDHEAPACEPECGEGQFCGSDCVCHRVTDPLPDLMIDRERLASEIVFDEIIVDESSCSVVEGCVTGSGERRLLRFSVEAVNQGLGPLAGMEPATRPDLFEYSPCHGHFHFSGFASFRLLDAAGAEVVMGRKQAFCIEDTVRRLVGPAVPCNKRYTCEDQGLQPGWSDVYGNSLDCQWLDITDLEPGDYQLEVELNPLRQIEEVTLTNNTATVPVTVPPVIQP